MGLKMWLKALLNWLHIIWNKYILGITINQKGLFLLKYCYQVATDTLLEKDQNSTYEEALTTLQEEIEVTRKGAAQSYFTYLYHMIDKKQMEYIMLNFGFDPRKVIEILTNPVEKQDEV